MLPSECPALPAWASYRTFPEDHPDEIARGHVVVRGGSCEVLVDADAAYPAFLAEYRALYASGHGDLNAEEWAPLFENLESEPEEVEAYWLEVMFQSLKLDLFRVFGVNVNIHIKHSDPAGKDRWRQGNAPKALRDPNRAAGFYLAPDGKGGERRRHGTEARQHYKRLRGVLPV